MKPAVTVAVIAVAVAVAVTVSFVGTANLQATSARVGRFAMGGGDASGAGAPEEEQQGQEQKRAAAAAYDYEGDARWADFWSNVLLPPHLAGKPEVLAHFRRKFYQRFIDRDLVVVPMFSTGSTQQSRPDVRSSPSASSESVRARNTGSSSRSAAPPPPPQTNSLHPLNLTLTAKLF